jgi:hypothetical protein
MALNSAHLNFQKTQHNLMELMLNYGQNMGPKRSKSSLQPRQKAQECHQLSASITAQVLDNLKQSGLLFNTSQQSQAVPN